MELRHLRYFRAVAELLNFSRAAEQLRVAQPALSRQIRALEEELGAQLFERNRVRVQLTDAGRTFYTQACRILAQVESAIAAVQEVSEGAAGELIIGNDWRLGGDTVSATVGEFQAKHPRAEVTLLDLRIHEQLTAVRTRRAHVGFVVRDLIGARNELESLTVLRSRLMAALPAKHPFAGRALVPLADLADETWLTLDEKIAPGYRPFLAQLCRLSGFTPQFGRSAGTIEGLFGRVASGYGVALALESGLPQRAPLLRFVPTDCEPLELCAVWHRQETSALLKSYLQVLRKYLEETAPVLPPKSRRNAD